MIRRRKIILVVVLVLASVGLVWLSKAPPEPSYQGKSLTEWLALYGNGTLSKPAMMQPNREANDAVQHMGTNAVPTLLRMFQARDSAFKLKLYRFIGAQHFINADIVPARARNIQAAFAFWALGPVASNAAPDVIRMVEDGLAANPSSNQVSWPISVLSAIGPAASNAVPALVRATTNQSMEIRLSAAMALGNIHAHPDVAVPALVRALGDTDNDVCTAAIQGLGEFRQDARPALPALLAQTASMYPQNRQAALIALTHFDSPTVRETIVPRLIRLLHNQNTAIRRETMSCLAGFGSDAVAALPALRELLNDPDPLIQRGAQTAINSLETASENKSIK